MPTRLSSSYVETGFKIGFSSVPTFISVVDISVTPSELTELYLIIVLLLSSNSTTFSRTKSAGKVVTALNTPSNL